MSGCLFCQKQVQYIDYKDVGLLERVLKPDGTIRPRRGRLSKKRARSGGSGLCRRHQTQLAVAVRRARFMALLPPGPPPRTIEWPPRSRGTRR